MANRTEHLRSPRDRESIDKLFELIQRQSEQSMFATTQQKPSTEQKSTNDSSSETGQRPRTGQ